MKILEIPSYRKNQLKNNFISLNPTSSSSTMALPTRIPEIPPFRPRKTSEHSPIESTSYGYTNQPSLTQGCPEWMKRLKTDNNYNNNNNSTTVHRSVDCIPAGNKDPIINVETNPINVTAQWINMTNKRESVSNANLASKKSPDEDTKGK